MSAYKELIPLNEVVSAIADGGNTAYIKRIPSDKGTGYALYSSEGKQLAVYASREAAYFTARQHELEPVSLH